MSQSNDMPRLPLTWTRFKYLSVAVPSLERGMSSAARLPALAVCTRPPNNVPGPTTHTFRAEGQLDTGAVASAVPIWLLRGLALRSRPRGGCHTAHPGRFGRTAQGLAWRYCAAGRGLTPARPTSLSPTLHGRGILPSAGRSCSDWTAFSTGPACTSATRGGSFGSIFPRASGGNGTGRPRRRRAPSSAPAANDRACRPIEPHGPNCRRASSHARRPCRGLPPPGAVRPYKSASCALQGSI